MQQTIDQRAELFGLVSAMAREQDPIRVASRCLEAACRIAGAGAGTLYTLDVTGRRLVPVVLDRASLAHPVQHGIELYPGDRPDMTDPRTWCAFTGEVAIIASVARVHGFSTSAILARDQQLGSRTQSLMTLPLRGNEERTIGVLELANLADAAGKELDQAGLQALIAPLKAFAYQAAITISNAMLLEHNRSLVRQLDLKNNALRHENQRLLEERQAAAAHAGGLVTSSPGMLAVLDMIGRVASSSVPVLVLGETGTGKEVVARLVHAQSPRRDAPFIAQNCAALPSELLESELFGYRKGAFSGAVADKKGLFEAADGGTLFLDEIGDMLPGLQTKLLRVLQDGEIRPLGATQGKRFDVRIVAATNVSLKEKVADGKFREDLFYRLSVFPLSLPPLRERAGDVAVLANHFIGEMSKAHGKPVDGITARALAVLEDHRFPGNIRELRNIIERAIILCQAGGPIDLDCLPAELQAARPAAHVLPPDTSFRRNMRLHEADAIVKALEAHGGNRTRAAEALGLSRRTLQEKIARYGVGRRPAAASAAVPQTD